jgi:hypothetical protein
MKQYIDKDALVTEVKRLIDRSEYSEVYDYAFRDGNNAVCVHILNFLNNLKVKEVNLEKELNDLIEKEKAFVTDNREVKYYNGDSFNHIYELEFIAKYFFELGLKANKGE